MGAPSKASFAGAAYVYVNSGGVWTQQAKLTAADGDAGDRLGWSVALAGPTAILGTPNKDAITGAAYVFVNSGGTWTQQAKLAAADGAAGDYFGWAVGTSGSVAVVGAPNRNALTGEVYVFVRSGDTWSQNAEFTATDAVPGDYFGWSAAIAGATVVAGSPLKYSQTGAAYVFAHSGSIWRQQAKLTASDGDANDWFASSVAVSRSTVVVGAYYKEPSHVGAVYVYTNSGGVWSELAKLTASDGEAYDNFGYSVGISRSTAVFGAPGHGSNGAAYIFIDVREPGRRA